MKKTRIFALMLSGTAILWLPSCDQVNKIINGDSSGSATFTPVKGDNLNTVSAPTTEEMSEADKATDKIIDIYRSAINKCAKARSTDELDYISRGLRTDIGAIPPGTPFNAAQRNRIKEVEGEYLEALATRYNEITFGQAEPDESLTEEEFMARDE